VTKKSARPNKAAIPRASAPSQALRQRAEAKFRAAEAPSQVRLSSDETRRVLHELQVHQIELEMQNEELHQAQAELEASRELYIDLYDLAPVSYVTLSEKGLILEANLTAAGLLGVERSALVKQPLTRFIIPEDQAIFYHHRKQLFETGAPQVCELRLMKRDAVPFWARLEATTAQDAVGAVVGRTVISDINEGKEAETRIYRLNAELEARVRERTAELEAANRELRASEEKYRTVADFTYAWEYWLGPEGNYLYVSPSCERITGYRPEEFRDNPALLEAITHPADRAQLSQHLHEAGAHGTARHLEFRILARNGEVRWIGHWCQPVYTSDGKWLGQRGSNRDITVSRQAEAIQKEMEVLQQMDRLRAELIGNISHELRTPLGLILVMVTALHKDYIFTNLEKRGQILLDIEEEARNLQEIVDQLLDESHLQSGHLVLDQHVVDLRTLIGKTVDLQAAQAPQHRLSYQLPEAELLAALDARRIEQVLRNLLDNAVKYSPAGTAITVRADAVAETLRIAVSDEGPGIPSAERERIFERFYRVLDPEGPPVAGLGLGLSICRGIVKAHGGRLWVEERPGGGSVFVFTLPKRDHA
jgi:PAS domain S-box-containing protein